MSQVVVRPILPCPSCDATIEEMVTLRNVTGRTQIVHLRGSYGTRRLDFGRYTIRAHSKLTAQDAVLIRHPHLWSLGRPTLYRASLTLSNAAGARLGGYVTYSGIRSISVSGGVVTLNGRRLNLRGVGLHESDVVQGAALDPAHIARIIGWVRQLHAHDHPRALPAESAARGARRPLRAFCSGTRSRSTRSRAFSWPTPATCGWPTRCCRTTSPPTRTIRRSCSGASATSCRPPPVPAKPRMSAGRPRSLARSIRPGRWVWRSAPTRAPAASRPTPHSTSSGSTTTSAGTPSMAA